MTSATYYRYVSRRDVSAHEGRGWKALTALQGTHHGVYSVLMQWTGEGEPIVPREAAE